jgi:HEAT repeat protein
VAAPERELRELLSGGDRRSIASSNRARALIEREPGRIAELAELTRDDDWLVSLRALDLLEKLAHERPEWVEPYKKIFIGPLSRSDKWEVRLQIVRALPLFAWTPAQARRVESILTENLTFPQLFVRAWALDSLARIAETRPRLEAVVRRHVREFERSPSKALRARARNIAARLDR